MTGRVSISKSAYAAIMHELKKAYPYEGCGLLLANKRTGIVESIGSVENVEEKDKQVSHYIMDPMTLYRLEKKAEENDLTVAGFYHSHPGKPAILSGEDKQYMIPGMIYMIVSTSDGGIEDVRGYIKDEPGAGEYRVLIVEA